MINDGSTDNSESICLDFKKNYGNVKYYYKSNSGVSDTRNFGINISSGSYITFVDSDDYLDVNFLRKMSKYIELDYDMIVCNHIEVNNVDENKISLFERSKDITFPKCINVYFDSYFLSTVCKMLFSKKLLLENNIYFNTHINYGEDMLFSFMVYFYSKKTYFLNYSGYYYYLNSYSVSNSKNVDNIIKYCNDNLNVYNLIRELIEKTNNSFDYDLFVDGLLKNFVSGIDKILDNVCVCNFKIIDNLILDYYVYFKKFRYYKSSLNYRLKIKILLLRYKMFGFLIFFKKIKKWFGGFYERKF